MEVRVQFTHFGVSLVLPTRCAIVPFLYREFPCHSRQDRLYLPNGGGEWQAILHVAAYLSILQVQQEFAFIPDDGSATYVINVETNSTHVLAGPSTKDADAIYFAGITSLVQLDSKGVASYLPYTESDNNANAAATWNTVSALASAVPTSSSSSSTGTASAPASSGTSKSSKSSSASSASSSSGSSSGSSSASESNGATILTPFGLAGGLLTAAVVAFGAVLL